MQGIVLPPGPVTDGGAGKGTGPGKVVVGAGRDSLALPRRASLA